MTTAERKTTGLLTEDRLNEIEAYFIAASDYSSHDKSSPMAAELIAAVRAANLRIALLEAEVEHVRMLCRSLVSAKEETTSRLILAGKYLKEGKAKFSPNTTNSFVDEMIAEIEAIENDGRDA